MRTGNYVAAGGLALVGVVAFTHLFYGTFDKQVSAVLGNPAANYTQLDLSVAEASCPTLKKLVPPYDASLYNLSHFRSDEYRQHSLDVWAGAVNVYTPSFDDLGPVGEDERWEVFYEFEKYLLTTFPTVAARANLDHANEHGLIFTFAGSNPELKPLMLTGHQDVVPVPPQTAARWTHPFDGYFDGQYLWGRGASDCKNNVIGIMEALEALFSSGFENQREIIVALGFDEEISGNNGANYIGQKLLERLGENSVFAIVDEGGMGVQDKYGSRFAYPSTGEKGYLDVIVTLNTDGGHSSVPPRHTAIGILAEVITEIEAELYPVDLSDANPFYYQLQCEAKAGHAMEPAFRTDIQRITTDSASKQRVLDKISEDLVSKTLISTSQAVDIVFGGLKINALPEEVTVKINNRVAYESSLETVKHKIESKVVKVAEKYGLGVVSFDNQTIVASAAEFKELPSGRFVLQLNNPLDPAPMTPTIGNPTWEVLGGTIRHIFEDFAVYPGHDAAVGSEVTVSPSVMTGNTDTKWYWPLSKNIYRFTPIRQEARANAHAIDEKVDLDAHIEAVAFYHELVRNFDADFA